MPLEDLLGHGTHPFQDDAFGDKGLQSKPNPRLNQGGSIGIIAKKEIEIAFAGQFFQCGEWF